MGDWSTHPWGTDEAADWFHRFWITGDFSLLINEIQNFNPKNERYDSVRAASYLLQTLGIVYVWPVKYLDVLKPLLSEAILILNNMINPPNEDWCFIDICENDEEILKSVQNQIESLKIRLSEIK